MITVQRVVTSLLLLHLIYFYFRKTPKLFSENVFLCSGGQNSNTESKRRMAAFQPHVKPIFFIIFIKWKSSSNTVYTSLYWCLWCWIYNITVKSKPMYIFIYSTASIFYHSHTNISKISEQTNKIISGVLK